MIRNLKPLLSSISRQQIVNARVVTRTYTVSRRTTATTTTGHSSVFQPSIQYRTFASDATTNNTTNTTTSTTNDANNTVDINASSSEPIVASDSKTINQPTIADKFAIVHIKGHQYKVAEDDVLTTEKIDAEVGDTISLDKVLLIGTKETTKIGTPLVDKAVVKALVEEQTLTSKLIVFKKKRRKGYERTQGHRQQVTTLRILSIEHEA